VSLIGYFANALLIVAYVSFIVKRRATRVTIHDIPGDITPDALLALAKENPMLVQQFQENSPEMGSALASGDLPALRLVMMKQQMQRYKHTYQRDQEMAAIAADPDNPENQRKMAEAIRQQNVQQNMELAMENLPESFARVNMLYVNLSINDYAIKAFVDSGAQSTIISGEMAERCGLMRLLDTRYAGQAVGIGTSKILGRVHIAQMKFGNSYFPISLTVLESNGVDFLFGLDMLRRYRGIIDLGNNVLKIDKGGGDYESLPFLGEGDIPSKEKDFGEGKAGGDVGSEDKGTSSSSDSKMDVADAQGGSAAKDSSGSGSEAKVSTSGSGSEWDAKVAQLMALGFPEGNCVAALRNTDGDVDTAASILLANADLK
jgi:DNA damage-inducible protein 1